jgi:hypothetical protein
MIESEKVHIIRERACKSEVTVTRSGHVFSSTVLNGPCPRSRKNQVFAHAQFLQESSEQTDFADRGVCGCTDETIQ